MMLLSITRNDDPLQDITSMSLALGLDAGGTYTDAVLYDLSNDTPIASGKAQTTPPTYVDGVAEALSSLPEADRRRASYVALSTTLATNAIVEGRHAPAGIILIGYDAYEAGEIHWQPKRVVPGRHTIRGAELVPFDEDAFRAAVADLLTEGIAGLAISSLMGTRNPEHELRAVEIARSMTGIPLVLGHQVAGVLNALVRAETAAMNAGLIPLVHRFIHAVESVLEDAGLVNVPCFMVTGDGSLISTEAAKLRPVETILSGPACSVLGAARLAGEMNSLVVDIGGTTTDVAVLENGVPRMAKQGVTVGKWRAGVSSAHVLTRGLGGDSSINIRPGLSVGPRRIVPISSVGSTYPDIVAELEKLLECLRSGRPLGGDWRLTNPVEVFVRVAGDPPARLSEQEGAILRALDDGPKTRRSLAESVGYPYASLLQLDRLERWGLVQRAGLTPTDLWHTSGEYSPWDTKTAQVAAEIVALRLGMTVEELNARVRELTAKSLTRQVTQAHFGIDGSDDGCSDSTLAGRLARVALGEVPTDGLRAKLMLTPPIIGVGAPAGLFLRSVAERVGGQLIVPDGAPVANAVGAAIGAVVATSSALIRPQEDGSVLCYGPEERIRCENRNEAVEVARAQVVPAAEQEMARRGASQWTIEVTVEHRGAEVADSSDPIWWETHVSARGVGRPLGAKEGDEDPENAVCLVETWTPGLKEVEQSRADDGVL